MPLSVEWTIALYMPKRPNVFDALAPMLACCMAMSISSCGIKLKTSTDYLMAGNEYFKADEYAKAEKEYREALKLDSSNPTAKNNLGVILSEEGRYDEAIQILRDCTKNDPKNAIAHYVLASALTKQGQAAKDKSAQGPGQYDEAIIEAQLGTQLDPSEPAAFKALGEAALAKGDSTLAINAFRDAIRLDPDNDAHPHRLALALQRTEDWDAAAAQEQRALELNPDNSEARIGLALDLKKKGGREDAVAELEKVLQREPNNELARKYLSEFKDEATAWNERKEGKNN